jgi:hypothetical protein
MNWNEYFEMMKDWKKLPAYKAEPRIDSLVGFYLKDALTDFLGVEIIGIIPELPIRLATVKPQHESTNYADRSYKVDFYAVDENSKDYLIEFKTDSGSRRIKQDDYLREAQQVGIKKVIEGIFKIYKASSYKRKYEHLIKKLNDFQKIDLNGEFIGIEKKIEIIYFQPKTHNEEERCIDFKWFSNWLNEKYPNTEFEMEFSKALRIWGND